MTLPINPVNIQNTGVIPSEVQRLLDRVVQGSEIGQRQQQLELEKERQKAEREKLQQAEKAHQEEKEQLARFGESVRALLMSMETPTILPQGALPGAAGQAPVNVGPTTPFAQMLQGLRAEDMPGLLPILQQVQGLQGQAALTTGQNLQNVGAARDLADDAAIDRLVDGFSQGPTNRQTVGRLLRRVAAINPAKAQTLANTFSGLIPGYTPHLNDNGTVSYVSSEPGGGVVGAPLQPKGGDADQRKMAGYARRVSEAHATLTELELKYPEIGQIIDDQIRIARSLGQLPAVGRSAETFATPVINRLTELAGSVAIPTKDLRAYLNARTDMANAIVRPETGAAINMDELEREIAPYVPSSLMKGTAQAEIQRRRAGLTVQFADRAGPEWNLERLSPLARRYFLRALRMNDDPQHTDLPLRQSPGVTLVPR